jgi:cellulose synthase/poly-beta-1,6-N-acetylglucosamine synthase-like glycosyltransferase
VITCTNRPQFMERVFSNYLGQTHPRKELIIILNHNSLDIGEWQARSGSASDIHIYQLDERTSLGECYNFAVGHCINDYIAKFDDDDYYAPRYLEEALYAFQITDAGIVGKICRYVYFEGSSTLALCSPAAENSYTHYVVGATMVIKKEVFKEVRFRNITIGEDSEFQNDCREKGIKIYALNKYNYVTIRRPDQDSHTYKIADQTYLSFCQFIAHTDNYLDLVTI